LFKDLTKTTAISSDKHKHITDRRLFSNSQILKRRQLAYGAWNRACQLIAVQVPAKSTKTTANAQLCSEQTNATPLSPLFQLTGKKATRAGPRCSESSHSVDCRPMTCKIDEINNKRAIQTNANTSPIVIH
jgi:hypothetical protein